MSIKENAKYVKNELSSDEKLLESVLKFESLYKKHKVKVWAILAAIALFFVSVAASQAWKDHKNEKANEALMKLAADPNDKVALAELEKNNQPLYELYSYQIASQKNDNKQLQELSKSNNQMIADLSGYAVGSLTNKPKDSVYYQDLATIEKAYEAISKKDFVKAKELLDTIDEKSPMYSVAKLYKHYTISGVAR
ncbi:MAG: hypothetical protein PHE73_01365 [Sulfurovaceae bacterium]|nr:hypothetical protein [Sulfurovaceae bacterium]